MVSRVRSAAAARLWGAAWARGGSAARDSAHGPGGALSPARPRSLQSTARSSRAAGPEAGRSWRPRAGRRECHFLTWSPRDFHGLPRCLRVFSSASEGGRALLSASADAPERTGAREAGGSRAARRQPGGCVAPLPCARCLAFRWLWEREKQASCLSRPPSRLPFFPVLQILGSSSSGNAGRKLAREGGGGWKFLAAPRCVCMGPEEVGGWVEEHGVGGRTRSSESWSAALEITGQLGRKPPRSQEDPQPQPPASCPTTASEEGRRRRAGLGTEGARWNWKKSCLALILVVTVSLTLSILVPAFSYTNA